MSGQALAWVLFGLLILVLMVLDLGVLERRSRALSLRQAAVRTALWMAAALAFNAAIYLWRGRQPALEFLTGYLLEQSLSVDNLFVFLLVFSYFKVPAAVQHKTLFWGILGALLFRGLFIISGVALLHYFHWIIYLFGAFLVLTGLRMAFRGEEEVHPEHNPVLKLFRKLVPVTGDYEGSRFFVRREGRSWATPLFVVLLVIESTDVVFAVDSIPAVLAVTTDPFIVYTSNIFAILGLRSLYFALAGIMPLFHYLGYGLAFVLAFVGVKMLLSDICTIPTGAALGVVAAALALSVAASLLWPRPASAESSPADDGGGDG